MNVKDLENVEGITCLYLADEEQTLSDLYCGDLLSDVMANAAEGSGLCTIQAHKNTIAVASLLGLSAIILCNNRTATNSLQKRITIRPPWRLLHVCDGAD